MRRYTQDTLTDELAHIQNSTDSATNLLNVNAAAQTKLKLEEGSGKKLAPYMTTLGLEVEFAQQSNTVPGGAIANQVVLKDSAQNLIDNAHIEVADAPGLAMYPNIPFIVESDAARALEFVTPPLLAPLANSAKGQEDIIPDPAWEKAATRALEFGLKDRVEAPVTIETFANGVNTDWPPNLTFKNNGFKNHVYGPIRKEDKTTHTNAQVNYMTTLRHYAEINMSGVGGRDVETQKILTLLWSNGLSNTFGSQDESKALKAYAFVVSQKLREIQGALNDWLFAVVLEADNLVPQADSEEENIVNWSQEDIGNSGKKRRWLLAMESSKIKDQAQLWLKGSYHQVLDATPPKYRDPILGVVKNQEAAILDLLAKARVFQKVTSSMMRFYGMDESEVKLQLDFWLQQALWDTTGDELGAKSLKDQQNRPSGQKDRAHRDTIVGARSDTYVPTDTNIADDPLFLVESRLPTTYLGLEKRDRYRYSKALEKVDTQIGSSLHRAAIRQYFDLRDALEVSEIKLGKFGEIPLSNAKYYVDEVVVKQTSSYDFIEELIRLGETDDDRASNNETIRYLRTAMQVAAKEGQLTGFNVLDQAKQWYDEI